MRLVGAYGRWRAGSETRKSLLASIKNENGKIGWILLWALGVPIPILLILFAVRGCT